MSPFGIVGIFRRCPDADELRHCFGLDVLDEGVELVVDGVEPHLNLAVVLPVLRAWRHDWDTTRTGQKWR